MALTGAVQSFFILVVVILYSSMVWKSLDQYFRDEFKKHLAKDLKKIEHLNKEDLHSLSDQLAKQQTNQPSYEMVHKQMTQKSDSLVQLRKSSKVDTTQSCKIKDTPADKYLSSDLSEENYLDSDEVCSFTQQYDTIDDGIDEII